jgi:hypothetical protein
LPLYTYQNPKGFMEDNESSSDLKWSMLDTDTPQLFLIVNYQLRLVQ